VETGRLRGVKTPVADADIADFAVVLAAEGDSAGLFLVELEQPGVLRERLRSLDDSRPLARLSFAGARVEPLGGRGMGLALYAEVFMRAAVLLAFEQLGGADRCLELARDHAAELPVAAAAARLAAGDAFGFAARENIQVHGGMGFTWECDAHLYFRRARHLSLVAGAPAHWTDVLVDALTRPVAAMTAELAEGA
jgi:alkylation response protein AidB-like acyl-CoA dehydrogenase